MRFWQGLMMYAHTLWSQAHDVVGNTSAGAICCFLTMRAALEYGAAEGYSPSSWVTCASASLSSIQAQRGAEQPYAPRLQPVPSADGTLQVCLRGPWLGPSVLAHASGISLALQPKFSQRYQEEEMSSGRLQPCAC